MEINGFWVTVQRLEQIHPSNDMIRYYYIVLPSRLPSAGALSCPKED